MLAAAGMLRARSWLYDLFAWNHAENLRTSHAAQRKSLGLLGMTDLPYPGAVTGNTINIHEAPAAPVAPNDTPAQPARKRRVFIAEEKQPDGTWRELHREVLQ